MCSNQTEDGAPTRRPLIIRMRATHLFFKIILKKNVQVEAEVPISYNDALQHEWREAETWSSTDEASLGQ